MFNCCHRGLNIYVKYIRNCIKSVFEVLFLKICDNDQLKKGLLSDVETQDLKGPFIKFA